MLSRWSVGSPCCCNDTIYAILQSTTSNILFHVHFHEPDNINRIGEYIHDISELYDYESIVSDNTSYNFTNCDYRLGETIFDSNGNFYVPYYVVAFHDGPAPFGPNNYIFCGFRLLKIDSNFNKVYDVELQSQCMFFITYFFPSISIDSNNIIYTNAILEDNRNTTPYLLKINSEDGSIIKRFSYNGNYNILKEPTLSSILYGSTKDLILETDATGARTLLVRVDTLDRLWYIANYERSFSYFYGWGYTIFQIDSDTGAHEKSICIENLEVPYGPFNIVPPYNKDNSPEGYNDGNVYRGTTAFGDFTFNNDSTKIYATLLRSESYISNGYKLDALNVLVPVYDVGVVCKIDVPDETNSIEVQPSEFNNYWDNSRLIGSGYYWNAGRYDLYNSSFLGTSGMTPANWIDGFNFTFNLKYVDDSIFVSTSKLQTSYNIRYEGTFTENCPMIYSSTNSCGQHIRSYSNHNIGTCIYRIEDFGTTFSTSCYNDIVVLNGSPIISSRNAKAILNSAVVGIDYDITNNKLLYATNTAFNINCNDNPQQHRVGIRDVGGYDYVLATSGNFTTFCNNVGYSLSGFPVHIRVYNP